VHEVLRAPGQPLDRGLGAAMSERLGHDFGSVRVHADETATRSARSLGALAYTVGRHIVFGQGQYSPGSPAGRQLLAHELVHVAQQRQHPEPRANLEIGAAGDRMEQEAQRAAEIVAGFQPHSQIPRDRWPLRPHTVPAKGDGRPLVARQLSPERSPNVTATGSRGATGSGLSMGTAWCGPDATRWFVKKVNTEMSDPVVMAIRGQLEIAGIAAGILGTTAEKVAEAGTTGVVLGQEGWLGRSAPPRDITITSQLARGAASIGAAAKAIATSPFSREAVPPLEKALGTAALLWRSLVNHGARYDFKAHVMNHPHSASSDCPDRCDPGEVGTITFCPGNLPENCYESDLPGNLFYALIGRHVGWSELTLQLGSQLAEITDTAKRPYHPKITWDTPQDTAAIRLGYGLPLPLTTGALCAMLAANRTFLAARHGCADCLAPPQGT
jgi:hypothetical protein